MPATSGRVRVIACGALAHELSALRKSCVTEAGATPFEISCLPPELHNTPDGIPQAVETAVVAAQAAGEHVFVAYADCGTGGLLDAMLQRYGVERLPGAHCYEFYAGSRAFAQLAEEELGTFYLTDFLVRHFERLVVQSLGIDRHPELIPEYFRHYRRLVYLRQANGTDASDEARAIAGRLGLSYQEVDTGYGELATASGAWLKRHGVTLVVNEREVG